MNKIASILILTLLACSISQADPTPLCNWATDIKKIDSDHYSYTLNCHLAVGQLVQDAPLKDKQIADLQKVVTLDQLALKDSEARADMWMNTSLKLTDTVNHYESMRQSSEVLYFASGVVLTVLSVYAAGQLKSR